MSDPIFNSLLNFDNYEGMDFDFLLESTLDLPQDFTAEVESPPSFSLLHELPDRVVQHIFQYLLPSLQKSIQTNRDVCAIRQVSQAMNRNMMDLYRRQAGKAPFFWGPDLFKHNPAYLPQKLQTVQHIARLKEEDMTGSDALKYEPLPPDIEEESISLEDWLDCICTPFRKNAYQNFSYFLSTAYCPASIKKVDLTMPSLTIKNTIHLLRQSQLKGVTHLKLDIGLRGERTQKEELLLTIASLPQLKTLELKRCVEPAQLIPALQFLSQIEGLRTDIDNDTLASFTVALNECQNLKVLRLEGLIEQILPQLTPERLKKLEVFHFTGAVENDLNQMREKSRSAFAKMTSLQELFLEAEDNGDYEYGLVSHLLFDGNLPKSPMLTNIRLKDQSLSKEDVKCLIGFNQLEKLHLESDCWIEDGFEIDDAAIQDILSGKEHLQDLVLICNTLTSDGILEALLRADCANLRSLKIQCVKGEENLLEALLQTYPLEYVSITYIEEDDMAIDGKREIFHMEQVFQSPEERMLYLSTLSP
jgi:hypothetical protein